MTLTDRHSSKVTRLLLVIAISLYVDELRAENQSACPPMQDPAFIDGKTRQKVEPINNANEYAQTRKQLLSTDPDKRRLAIAVLAMSGDMDLLHTLVKQKNYADLRYYAGYYRNQNRTRCLPPEVEKIVLENLSTAELGAPLLTLFRNNIYQSQQLADRLLAIDSNTPGYDRSFENVIVAFTATKLATIADKVLLHAKNRVNYYREKYAQLPQFNELKAYLTYFEQQNNPATLQYFYELVREASPEKLTDYQRSSFSGFRQQMYALAGKSASLFAKEFLINEAEKLLAAQTGTAYVKDELVKLYDVLFSLPLRDEDKDTLLKHIDVFLKNSRQSRANDIHVYQMRTESYKALGRIHTARAFDRLVAEIKALIVDTSANETDLDMLVRLASDIAKAVEVDFAALLASNPFPDDVMKNSPLVEVLTIRPYPQARAYLTGLLATINVSGREFYFDQITEALAGYDSEAMLKKTNAELEKLYQAEKLTANEFERLHVTFTEQELAVIKKYAPMLDNVRRVFYFLKLPVRNGTVSLKGGENTRLVDFYLLANDERIYLLSEINSATPMNISLLSYHTGKRENICGIPVISPDKTRLACRVLDLELGEAGNAINIYQVTAQGIKLEWSYHYPNESHSGPGAVRWVDNLSLNFNETYYKDNQLKTRPAQVIYRNGEWQKQYLD